MLRLQVDPDKPFSDLLFIVSLQAEEIPSKGCKGQEARAKVTLLIENHSLYLKQKFDIDFIPDTEAVVICEKLDQSSCHGGKPSLCETVFPTQLYWKGNKKTLVKAICWCPSEENPDFNLHVDMRSHAFTPDHNLDEVKNMGVSTTFIVYGEKETT
jgi:hypothetical protein